MTVALSILGAFCIAYNLSNLLHELGHATAAWLSGGGMKSIVLNPFAWNRIYLRYGSNRRLVAWGGVVFGVAFAIVMSLPAMLVHSPYLVPLYLLGGCALAVNGIYLAIAVFAAAGDAGDLMSLGVSKAKVAGVGVVLIGLSCIWFVAVQPLLGIGAGASLAERFLILHAGILPYLAAMALYAVQMMRQEAPLFLAFAGSGVVAVSLVACIGHVGRTLVAVGVPVIEPTMASAVVMLVEGLLVVIGELALFAGET